MLDNNYWVYTSHWPDDQSSQNTSKGIGIYKWSSAPGKLENIAHEDAVGLSSYLAINHQLAVLYSIDNEHIDSFKIDLTNGTLTPQSRLQVDGRDGCYLSLSHDNRFLLVAYYSSGNIASYQLADDGSLVSLAHTKQHKGSSINPDSQESAHPHMIIPVPESPLILVPDLGTDLIMGYQLDEGGRFQHATNPHTKVEPGHGPRHVAFHPTQPFVYVLAELTSRVVGFKLEHTTGHMEHICDLSMLPDDFEAFTKAADIHITPDGKYLYASNRGHDSLAIFQINQADGTLNPVRIMKCGGSWPRAFAIDPEGSHLLVANKRSNLISVNKIDAESGLYQELAKTNTASAPQCIRFIKT